MFHNTLTYFWLLSSLKNTSKIKSYFILIKMPKNLIVKNFCLMTVATSSYSEKYKPFLCNFHSEVEIISTHTFFLWQWTKLTWYLRFFFLKFAALTINQYLNQADLRFYTYTIDKIQKIQGITFGNSLSMKVARQLPPL